MLYIEFGMLLQKDIVALQHLALKRIVKSLFLTLDYSAGMCKLCVITPALNHEGKGGQTKQQTGLR